jgi:hypothetical protein
LSNFVGFLSVEFANIVFCVPKVFLVFILDISIIIISQNLLLVVTILPVEVVSLGNLLFLPLVNGVFLDPPVCLNFEGVTIGPLWSGLVISAPPSTGSLKWFADKTLDEPKGKIYKYYLLYLVAFELELELLDYRFLPLIYPHYPRRRHLLLYHLAIVFFEPNKNQCCGAKEWDLC